MGSTYTDEEAALNVVRCWKDKKPGEILPPIYVQNKLYRIMSGADSTKASTRRIGSDGSLRGHSGP